MAVEKDMRYPFGPVFEDQLRKALNKVPVVHGKPPTEKQTKLLEKLNVKITPATSTEASALIAKALGK